MTNLCYSTFMQLLKAHYAYSIEQENLARGLLEEITSPDFHDKFSSVYLSHIWSGDRDITKALIEETAKSSNQQSCIEYFRYFDARDIDTHTRDDFYDKLSSLIENDDTITATKKSSLTKLYASTDYGKYLANVFLYALRKPNKKAVADISPLEFELLREVDCKCPLCNTSLVEKKQRKTFYRFSVSKIYPDNLTTTQEADFSSIHNKPIEIDDKVNKICLCDKCASEYLFAPTIEIYDKLYRLKWAASTRNQLEMAMDRYNIEDQIIEILDNLKGADIESDSFASLRMKPLTLTKKILPQNKVLKQNIADDNNRYFYFIQEHLVFSHRRSNLHCLLSYYALLLILTETPFDSHCTL